VTRCQDAITGTVHPDMETALRAAPADTLTILIESGVMSAPVLTILSTHTSRKVQEGAANTLMAALTGDVPGPLGR
jgi:hypothetical protein